MRLDFIISISTLLSLRGALVTNTKSTKRKKKRDRERERERWRGCGASLLDQSQGEVRNNPNNHENFIVTKPKSSYPSPPLLLGLWYLFIFPGSRKALQESVVLPGKQGFKLQIEYFLNYISLQPTQSIPQ